MGPWNELRYPPNHRFAGESIDLAFEIITEPESGPEYSHPNEIIWENYCYAYDVNFYGWEFDPRTGSIDMPKFEFYQELDPEDHWYQPNDRGIYWLGIAAIYDGNEPNYPWGWETRKHFFMDDAVRLFEWPVPGTKYPTEAFEPIEFEGVSWDLSFELISEDCYTGPDYAQWVSVGRPYCWCYPRQYHGDADGLKEGNVKTGYYHVGYDDLAVFLSGWKILEPPKGLGISPDCLTAAPSSP